MSLYYSSKHCMYPGDKGLTTAQKDQIHRRFKKFALDYYRAEQKSRGSKFDGKSRGLFGGANKCVVRIFDFFHSQSYREMALASKLANADFAFRKDDRQTITKKTATLLRAAGYKVDISNDGLVLQIWKPSK